MATKDTTYNSAGDVRLESADKFVAIAPSDTDDNITEGGVAYISRGISFATAGDLTVLRPDGTSVTIPSGALAAGIIHPIRCKRVLSSGTGALGIMAYW